MIYPLLTLNDDTEIVHSEMHDDGTVKVFIETPDERVGFKHAECTLPGYSWSNVSYYSSAEISYYEKLIRKMTHLILEFSQKGGFGHAPAV